MNAKVVIWGIGGLLAICLVVVVAGFISTGNAFFNAFQAKLVAPALVKQQKYDPNNIINQVYFFTTTCEAVTRDYNNWKVNENLYLQAKQAVSQATTQGDQSQAISNEEQDSTYLAGILGQLQNDAAAYNARSINYVANAFKSKGLPFNINVPANLAGWTPPVCG